jgi:hypothetical protein
VRLAPKQWDCVCNKRQSRTMSYEKLQITHLQTHLGLLHNVVEHSALNALFTPSCNTDTDLSELTTFSNNFTLPHNNK